MSRPKAVERLKMLVDRSVTQITSAGHGNVCLFESSQKGPQEIARSPHRAGKLVRNDGVGYPPGVYSHGVFIENLYSGAHLVKNTQGDIYIADFRDVFQNTGLVSQYGCRNYGNSGVLCSAYDNVSLKRLSTVDNKLIHKYITNPF